MALLQTQGTLFRSAPQECVMHLLARMSRSQRQEPIAPDYHPSIQKALKLLSIAPWSPQSEVPPQRSRSVSRAVRAEVYKKHECGFKAKGTDLAYS